jgi:predicted GIY-YIG superfamily endonuclease
MGDVYLIHFHSPISPKHTCQHYIGYADNGVGRRLDEHAAGRGARLTEVAKERGIGFRVVRTWENVDRNFERQLKRRKMANRYCPICQARAAEKKAA